MLKRSQTRKRPVSTRKNPRPARNQPEEFVKVVVDLPEPDLGISGEGLWAVPVGKNKYEIRSSPWHARNINWGDWVRAIPEKENQWPSFVRVVKRNGHRTLQVYFLHASKHQRGKILARINRFGASYENADGKMYAVDCPPKMRMAPMIQYLRKMRETELVDYRLNRSQE